MPPTTRKSFAYYTILVCLAIMGAAMLWGLLWQPSFVYGLISFRFRQGHLVFSLWTFVPAVLSLGLFIYYAAQTMKRRYPLNLLARGLLLALTFLVFTFLLRPALGYTGSSSANAQSQQAFFVYFLLLLFVRIAVVLISLVLLYQWRKVDRQQGMA